MTLDRTLGRRYARRGNERLRRPNGGSLVIEVTIDDPNAYTKLFTTTINHRLLPDTQLIEFVCIDTCAAHDVGADGRR